MTSWQAHKLLHDLAYAFFEEGGGKTPTWGLVNKYHTTSTYHAYYIVYRIC